MPTKPLDCQERSKRARQCRSTGNTDPESNYLHTNCGRNLSGRICLVTKPWKLTALGKSCAIGSQTSTDEEKWAVRLRTISEIIKDWQLMLSKNRARICWINPQCRSIKINKDQNSEIDPNVDQYRSLSIFIESYFRSLPEIWSLLIGIDWHMGLIQHVLIKEGTIHIHGSGVLAFALLTFFSTSFIMADSLSRFYPLSFTLKDIFPKLSVLLGIHRSKLWHFFASQIISIICKGHWLCLFANSFHD